MRRLSLLFAAILAALTLQAATVVVTSTLYNPDGVTFAKGSVNISWQAFVAADGHFVPAGSKLVSISSMGVFTTTLEPNTTATPTGTLYIVQYRFLGGPSPFPTEYWSCPASVTPITIPDCRTTSIAQPSGIVNISQLQPLAAAGACLMSTGTAWAGNVNGNCWTLQGTGVPVANCTVGWTFFRTDATAGSNLYLCTSTNVWTLSSGSSGGSGASLQALGTITTSPTLDGGNGTVKTITATLGANITSCNAIQNFTTGQLVTLVLTQDGTGSRTFACAGITYLGTVAGQASKTDVQTFVATSASTLSGTLGPMWCPDCSPAALTLPGSSSGFATIQAVAAAGGTQSVPATTGTFGIVVASGSSALGTSAIASTACATVVSPTATGVVTTDSISASFNGDPVAVTGYVPSTSGTLTIYVYPTADHANFKVCNSTSGSITPGAVTLNWRVTR